MGACLTGWLGCVWGGGADGRFDEALQVYDHWLHQHPDHVAALNNKAAILLNSGREAQVLIPPTLLPTLSLPCHAVITSRSSTSVRDLLSPPSFAWAQAAPLFERALSLDPGCTECLINLASFYQEEVRESAHDRRTLCKRHEPTAGHMTWLDTSHLCSSVCLCVCRACWSRLVGTTTRPTG